MTQITIIRTCKEQGTKEEVSIEYAVEKLNGYWIETKIAEGLMNGEEFFTPYETYKLKK